MKKVITTTLAVVITLAFVSCNDNGIGNNKGGPADRFVESFVTYTLTVNRNPTAGGTVSPSGSSTRSGGSSVTVSATAASGYTFTGWSGAPSGVNSSSNSVTFNMNGNRTLTANFTQNTATTYTLTVNRNPTAGGTVSPSGSSTHNAGTSVTVSATAASGYTFTGWSGASTSTSSSVSITMNGNRTLTANFTQSTPTTGSFTDSRDGKTYRTVRIGTQTWMAENLNYNASGSVCYNNSTSNCDLYGRLYNWSTVMNGSSSSSSSPSGVRGICPAGWHVPSDAEWTTLVNFAGSNACTKLQSRSGWNSGGNGTDDFGFSALPGGRGNGSGFDAVGDRGYWWGATDTEFDATFAWGRYMHWGNSDVYWTIGYKSHLYSLRCLEDVRP
jgi:uncharacterized protein (TIGR02145 family)/uncharacterized repeat protein (TIGR02543 family)